MEGQEFPTGDVLQRHVGDGGCDDGVEDLSKDSAIGSFDGDDSRNSLTETSPNAETCSPEPDEVEVTPSCDAPEPEIPDHVFEAPKVRPGAHFHVFQDVVGDKAKMKQNDVLYIGDFKKAARNVVFFQGDCQNYPEVMATHKTNRSWCQFNLYRAAESLHRKFPDDNVFIIRPSHMKAGIYAVYNNLCAVDQFGSPQYMADCGALNQLSLLLREVERQLRRMLVTVTSLPAELVVVGFSKGCVVLNQMLYELLNLAALESSEGRELGRNISTLYFLDGGHNGRTDTWVNNERVLRNLGASLEIDVRVYVTPYQMCDPERSWIGRQARKFVALLQKHRGHVTQVTYFSKEERCLLNHFRLLDAFDP